MTDSFYPDDDKFRDLNQYPHASDVYDEFVKRSAVDERRELPRISADDPTYSSAVMMLKRTKAEVEEFGKDLGAINAVVDLPVSAEVRRTVAKMFADPRNADAISESEWRKREHQYQIDKEQFGEKMNEHLKREKEVMNRELQQLGK